MSTLLKPRLRFKNLATDNDHEVSGQEARTLYALWRAADKGITALEISSWALRLSHYVWKLRKLSLVIDMVEEPHRGPAPGNHGRYFLRSGIQILETRFPV